MQQTKKNKTSFQYNMLRSLTHDILNVKVGSKSNPVFLSRINSLFSKYESKISPTKY